MRDHAQVWSGQLHTGGQRAPAGNFTLTAAYGGSPDILTSDSPGKTLTVPQVTGWSLGGYRAISRTTIAGELQAEAGDVRGS